MTTISVPLSEELLRQIEWLIDAGIASNKADAVRRALQRYAEEQAVQAVLDARNEESLDGDLDELATQL